MSFIRIEAGNGGDWTLVEEREEVFEVRELTWAMGELTAELGRLSTTCPHRALVDGEIVAMATPGHPPFRVFAAPGEEGTVNERPAFGNRVWLLHGDNVSPKICFTGCSNDTDIMLHLANDRLAYGPYLHAEEVVGGMVKLGSSFLSGDHLATDGIETVRYGHAELSDRQNTQRNEEASSSSRPSGSAWLVEADGLRAVLVIPARPHSFDLADSLGHHLQGKFSVKAIQGGIVSADVDYLVPGWPLTVAPAGFYGPAGPGARH